MALDLTYAAAAGYLDPACVDRVLALLYRLGFALWDDVLLECDAHGRLTVLGGLQEFREHLGGSLHVTLISDIGCGFEVTEMDDQLVVDAIHTLERREAALRRSVSAASAPVRV
jgi:3-dehydroquinate synthase